MGAGLASILIAERSPRPDPLKEWGGSPGMHPSRPEACTLPGPTAGSRVGGSALDLLLPPRRPYLPKQTAWASHPLHARPRHRKQAVTAPGPRLPPTRSPVSNPAPLRCDWLSAAQEAPRRSNGRPPEAAGSEVLHACGICSEGHDHFGQVFKCESAFG